MSVPRLAGAEFVVGLRWPGALGTLLLLGSLGYGLGMLRPAQEEGLALHARADRAERLAQAVRRGTVAAPQSAASRRKQFYGALPAQEQVTQHIDRVYAAATAEGLTLLHGEYSGADAPAAGLVRYRIVLPVKGSYGQVRRFITAATGSIPGLVLDDVNLQRHNVGEAQVEARVHLSLFLVNR